jgi:hypothetical protein
MLYIRTISTQTIEHLSRRQISILDLLLEGLSRSIGGISKTQVSDTKRGILSIPSQPIVTSQFPRGWACGRGSRVGWILPGSMQQKLHDVRWGSGTHSVWSNRADGLQRVLGWILWRGMVYASASPKKRFCSSHSSTSGSFGS